MGCDVHLIAEAREHGDALWERIYPVGLERDMRYVNGYLAGFGWSATHARTRWYSDRNYSLFGVLAGVRGPGPAIAEPRGVPDDLSRASRLCVDVDEGGLRTYDDTLDCAIAKDTGEVIDNDDVALFDHSSSWLTLGELMDYDWEGLERKETGLVPFGVWVKWVAGGRTGSPDTWRWAPFHGERFNGKPIIVEAEAHASLNCYDDHDRLLRMLGDDWPEKDVRCEWSYTMADDAGEFYTRVIPALAKRGGRDDVRIVFAFDS